MTNASARINAIMKYLNSLSAVRNFISTTGVSPHKIFELECYLKTAIMLSNKDREAIAVNQTGGFRPLFNPGFARNRSYLKFVDRNKRGRDLFLSMNGKLEGSNRVFHSPDIALTLENVQGTPLSIYECKDYSNTLGIGVYREFIGFLFELNLKKWSRRTTDNFRAFPELSPMIYTSAVAIQQHKYMAEKTYNFTVEDQL